MFNRQNQRWRPRQLRTMISCECTTIGVVVVGDRLRVRVGKANPDRNKTADQPRLISPPKKLQPLRAVLQLLLFFFTIRHSSLRCSPWSHKDEKCWSAINSKIRKTIREKNRVGNHDAFHPIAHEMKIYRLVVSFCCLGTIFVSLFSSTTWLPTSHLLYLLLVLSRLRM